MVSAMWGGMEKGFEMCGSTLETVLVGPSETKKGPIADTPGLGKE